eukprot:97927_1
MGICTGSNAVPTVPPNDDDKTSDNDDFLALFKDKTNGLLYQAFDKYIKWQACFDNSLSDEEVVEQAEIWTFVVSYVMAGDGVDEKERDLVSKGACYWTEGKLTLERANEIITEAANCKDEQFVLKKAKQLANIYDTDGGFNMIKSVLYDSLLYANGDEILDEREIERFKHVGNLWGVSQDELNELLELFHSEQKLLQDFYRIFECKQIKTV